MRFIMIVLLAVSTCAFAGQQPQAPTEFARWQMLDSGATQMPYLNRASLFLQNGVALAPDAGFSDGTIEFDVAVHGHAGFAGVVFRVASGEDYELIYLRTHRSRQWDALQYSPVFNGNEAWQLYTGTGYNGVAEIPANRWVHVRVVVAGRSAQVFVDNAPAPQMIVTDLKRPWTSGRVGLWGRSGAANFSNFRATPVANPAPAPAAQARDAEGVIAHWAISPAMSRGAVPGDRLPPALTWERVDADAAGTLNIGRYRTVQSAEGSTVYARAAFSVAAQIRTRLAFGYSDDVTVFLDGAPLFSGRAGYLSRDGSYLGTLTLGADAVFLNLGAGRHELTFAVSERFGGWGVAAKFEASAGITMLDP